MDIPGLLAAAVQEDFSSLARRGAVAVLLGLLVGAERQFSREEGEPLFAGVRTFPIIAMLGFAGALLADGRHPLILAAVLIGFGGLVVATYVVTSLRGDMGATTEISALVVILFGALCYHGYEGFASALAVVATLFLSLRQALHRLVQKLVRDDVSAVLKLAIVTLIVLPLLPNENFGPYGAWNPYRIWKYVVLIAGISFAGYVAVKVFGAKKGIGMTGILGGLASSTAVALAFSKRSRDEPHMAREFAVAIVLASTIMFPRVLITAAVISPSLLTFLWKPIAVLTAAGLAASGILFLRHARTTAPSEEPVATKNPFELGSAIKFGVFLALIFLVTRAAQDQFQEKGLYAASILAGLTDVDAITVQSSNDVRDRVTAARNAEEQDRREAEERARQAMGTAVTAIVLAMMSNTAVKCGMTVAAGSKELRRYTIPSFGAMIVLGLLSAFLLT
ncbi:MAG: MgtC/SapB family protein [Planctomycetes bacterium]|nr:MgtC/SapB family protein [Planctomycetota bacterium]